MKMFVEKLVLEQALDALETGGWNMTTRVITNLRAALAQEQAEQEPVAKMTAGRAMYFMERFKREEKMLGPNEQAALDFVISMLDPARTSVQEPVGKILPDWSTERECIAGTWACLNDLGKNLPINTLLYTAPPQRKPLTDEEIRDLCAYVPDFDISTHDLIVFARAAIAKATGEQP